KDANANISVIGLVRNRAKAADRFKNYANNKNLKLIEHDLGSNRPIEIDCNIDYVVHAASQASPKYYGTDPVGTMLPNIIGTFNLLELARKKKSTGFLLFSSGEVYGQLNDEQISVSENTYGSLDPMDVRSCYGESKRAAETLCVSYFQQYHVPVKIARIFHTYGPGMKLDDGRVFCDFVSQIVKNENIVLNSDGSAKRAFCYISDATKAFFKILLDGENGLAYNVGNDEMFVSIKQLAECLVNLFPEDRLQIVMDESQQAPGYMQSKVNACKPDTSRMRKLGWSPKISIEAGFRRTVEYYKSKVA
ncbi:MAG: NAD-dependent epimerase/dehydratase family protein, partial [Proteobacteria bacterium]|nr:NAD-dependent epimerase/dehydratase family protein [Pseudomonadota bacterium]